MSGFTVEGAAVEAARHQLSTVVDDVESAAIPVRAQLDRFLAGGWTGSAGRAFAAGWEEWEQGFTESMSGLRAMSEALARAAASYAEAERATSGALADVAGELS